MFIAASAVALGIFAKITKRVVRSSSVAIEGTPQKLIGFRCRISPNALKKFYMRTSRYFDSQIMAILKQVEASTMVPDLCCEHGMSSALFYKWRAKFGGMDASLMSRLIRLTHN